MVICCFAGIFKVMQTTGFEGEVRDVLIYICRNQGNLFIICTHITTQKDAATSPLYSIAGGEVWRGRALVLKPAAVGGMVKLVSYISSCTNESNYFLLTSALPKNHGHLSHIIESGKRCPEA
jgi:hypothetical protein